MATSVLALDNTSTYPVSIQELFERIATANPRAVAVQIGSRTLTYQELNALADSFAGSLLVAGVERGSLVGIAIARSPELIAAFLGTLKAGAAYLPLDPAYPAERFAKILADTEVSTVLVDEESWTQIQPRLTGRETILHTNEIPAKFAGQLALSPVAPDDLAYVMYTSGSTGEPKGVMIPHRGILRLVYQPDYLTIAPEDTFLQLAPVLFDASTFEIWGALLNGARLVLAPPHTLSLQEIAETIERENVSVLWLTAGLFNAVVDEYPGCLSKLRFLLAGGDVLSSSHVRKALAHLGKTGTLINGYGPTENTTFTCCHRITMADTAGSSIPIGRPINKTQVYILDADGAPISHGQIGELYTGGDGVALGYWRKPEATAQSFVPDPFSSDNTRWLYRTGDLAYQDETGLCYFAGRVDTQLKIRGFRIEPGEIETAARAHPAVTDAAVVAQVSTSGDKQLSCFYVTAPGTDCSSEALEGFLRGKLPDYAIPSVYRQLEKLPLNENGKVDRKVLALQQDHPIPQAASAFPTDVSALERELLVLLRGLLARPEMGPEDDFFKMGGNSLLAARFFAQLDKKFGKKLPLATMLQANTVRRLAAVIADDNWLPPWSSCVPLKTSGSYAPFFIVHALGGNVIGYKDLATSLSPEQPVYALQAQGLDGKSSVAHSVEEMAAHYVRAMQTIQPEGPYYLGGWSAGGRVAFEMARQLSNAGHSVAIVVIFDATIDHPRRELPPAQRMFQLIRWNLYNLGQIGFRTFTRKKVWNLRKHARIAVYDLHQRLGRKEREERKKTLSVQDAFMRAIRDYRPSIYSGDVFVFRTRDARFFSPGDNRLGWQNVVTGRLTFCDVPGNHDTIFQPPNLSVVAKELDLVLANTRRQWLPVQASDPIGTVLDEVSAASGLLFSPFLKQVVKQPGHLAVVSGPHRLTYEQVFRAASRLADQLKKAGAAPNRLIPVVMKKGWEQAVAVLAIQLAGAAYLPVDASWPEERRRYLFDVSEAAVALTQPDLASFLAWPDSLSVISVEESLWEQPAPTSPVAFEPVQTPADLAYVIFTSGSTGAPKGVMIDHQGALNTILDVNERFAVGPQDRVLALSSLSFDLSVYDIFGLLAAGGTIVFPIDDDKRDPRPWLQLISDERVTLWNTVPALMEMLVNTRGWEESCQSIRLALLSGDWIPVSLPERVWSGVPSLKLISLGGATEASIWSVLYPIESVHPDWASIPYGQAMKNQGLQVLDANLQPCPESVPGEIYISGIGLAKGYYKSDAITRERFLVHPETGLRLYRTGDLGRYLPSGDIEFLGREDLQVKINGFRIEINEIESALGKHPDVKACAIALLGQRGGAKRLAACVVGSDSLDMDVLRQFLAAHLPEYMVPHIWKQLPQLPLTSNGKVDRKALAEVAAPETVPEPAADSDTEAQIKLIWARALNIDTLSSKDGFLDLGGDSLSAIQVISDVAATLRSEVPLRMLFDNPDLKTFTEAVTVHQRESNGGGADGTEVCVPQRT